VLTALIAGIDSAIGGSIAEHLSLQGWTIFGTSRRPLDGDSTKIFSCDFAHKESIDDCINKLLSEDISLDLIVICVGILNPIGNFEFANPDYWEESFYVNALGPIRFLRGSMKMINSSKSPMIITFAGGGINSAPARYSAYTISKVALTKAMEIFSAESEKIRFVSIGTGWIKSPIHDQTLAAGEASGANQKELLRRIEINDFQSIESVSEFILWAFNDAGRSVTGRNFSLVHDSWGTPKLVSELENNPDKFKLRRVDNE
jgi:NAD(P)-dependent dehydrogenase (short-subunit alcohol dehydrogenase family)